VAGETDALRENPTPSTTSSTRYIKWPDLASNGDRRAVKPAELYTPRSFMEMSLMFFCAIQFYCTVLQSCAALRRHRHDLSWVTGILTFPPCRFLGLDR
jgi:hypothetical protein